MGYAQNRMRNSPHERKIYRKFVAYPCLALMGLGRNGMISKSFNNHIIKILLLNILCFFNKKDR